MNTNCSIANSHLPQEWTVLMPHLLKFLFLAGLLSFMPIVQAAPQYVVTDLGMLPGTAKSSGTALNNLGTVVGISDRDVGSALSGGTKGFVWHPSALNATSGTISPLNIPPTSGPVINDAGVIAGAVFVGYDANQSPILHAYTYDTAGLHDLGTLGGEFSSAAEINTSGQVAGYSDTSLLDPYGDVIGHAFLKNPGQPMIDLGSMGAEASGYELSYANGMNDYGQLAGGSTTSIRFYAFLWQPSSPNATQGAFTNLGTLAGDRNSVGFAINNYGQATGISYISSAFSGTAYVQHGFLWTPSSANGTSGTMTNIGTLLNNPMSEADAINSGGQVVGTAGEQYDPNALPKYTNQKAIIWNPVTPHGMTGTASDLNSLLPPNSGWLLQSALGINDAGQITGQGMLNGQAHGFLLTPVQTLAFAPSLTRAGMLIVRVTIANQGLGPVNLRATNAALGSNATQTMLNTVYPIPVGGSRIITLDFPLSSGASGTRTLLNITWRTDAGSFTSLYRVTLP